jgi:hypothetical protein
MRILLAAALVCASSAYGQRIEVTVPATAPLHGHLILVIAKKDQPEPRMQMSENYESAQAFGVDVDGTAGPIVVDAKTFGYPRRSLSDLEAADYFVQGVFNVYEQFHLETGKTLWLPPDKGEGQHWDRKPGNPYNAPVKLHLDPKSSATLKVTLDKVIPAIEGTDQDPATIAAKDPGAKWLKYMRFKSEKMTKFWGRDTYLGAWILLPDGFDEHPDARYPLVVFQDHYHAAMAPTFTSKKPVPEGGRRGSQQSFTASLMRPPHRAQKRPKPPALRYVSCSVGG